MSLSCREFNREKRVSGLNWGQRGREILQLDLEALRNTLCQREGSPNPRREELADDSLILLPGGSAICCRSCLGTATLRKPGMSPLIL